MINFYKERIDSKSMTLIKKLKITFKNKKNNSGSLILEYKDLDQLNKIIEIIKSNY